MPLQRPFDDPNVAQAFAKFPEEERACMLKLRTLVFQIADETKGVGQIEETLKWGQPAYLTPQTKSGSTLRLGLPKTGGVAIYAHCQTRIISKFQDLFPGDFVYEGNRAVHLVPSEGIALEKLALLIASALTYHIK